MELTGEPKRARSTRGASLARVSASLPQGLALAERCTATLRACLDAAGLESYRVFFCGDHNIQDVEDHLDALGEREARWHPAGPSVAGGEALDSVAKVQGEARHRTSGWMLLRRHDVAVARWYWVHPPEILQEFWLCAAPSAEHMAKLARELVRHRRTKGAGVWQVLRGGWGGAKTVSRDFRRDDVLTLDPDVRRRVDAEVLGFFDERVKTLYRSMGVPYRRGVLLHGPPGNGKTSLIRMIGASLWDVPAMLLRPTSRFDSDQFERVVERWRELAPAVLVLEDLDWLLKKVNVSSFLNLLDGLDTQAGLPGDGGGEETGGLLLIATTNHPNDLDPAINNRPGRFDVVIEVARPDASLRGAYLRRRLPDLSEETTARLTRLTDGVSFSDLQELVQLSGLMAIHAGREGRTEADLVKAAEQIVGRSEEAQNGFVGTPPRKFGLAQLVKGEGG